jgi:hypothetical protein
VEVEVCVLVKAQPARHLLLVSLFLHGLQGDRIVRKHFGLLIGQDAALKYRCDIRDRHDALKLPYARVHGRTHDTTAEPSLRPADHRCD